MRTGRTLTVFRKLETPPRKFGGTPPPPVNRMTDRCKNITLAKTSFRPVITQHTSFTLTLPRYQQMLPKNMLRFDEMKIVAHNLWWNIHSHLHRIGISLYTTKHNEFTTPVYQGIQDCFLRCISGVFHCHW